MSSFVNILKLTMLKKANTFSSLFYKQHPFLSVSTYLQAKLEFSISTHHHSSGSNQKRTTDGEQLIRKLLEAKFPQAKTIEVEDISGGCGSMYQIIVESTEFKGMRKVKMHQMVNDCLQKEIKHNMHGLRIHTAVPDDS